MTIKEVAHIIEELAPLAYAEDFDNVGLLVGDYQTEVTGVLVTLDTLEDTVDEAIESGCNLIVSFHPIIFSGLKKLNGASYVERVVLKAIRNNIAIYATHTALDNSILGVSDGICNQLGLINTKILLPKRHILKKLITYVPRENAEALKEQLFEAGAGSIGNYDQCSFNIDGLGTYRGNDSANPTIGKKGVLQKEHEVMVSVIFEARFESKIVTALQENHPYEEVAYEVITTDNTYQNVGMGKIGELAEPMSEKDFFQYVKMTMNTPCIRHSRLLGKPIKKVAVLGGSGSFAIEDAKIQGADAYISADFKYHDFFKAENKIMLMDIGHYESEQFTKMLLKEYLTKKITNFAIVLSEKSTNPIFYK
ncbi:MAG: Nif3-like dinuclear metal center hexameric protein [Flavobacteriaceae bacterium]|nr:Nif3-like dinuclear metal center hexameric protein [Flavobacteriaceae bacterium]|tara:strand:+ start:5091 stop:6185 length:1095 start_codon:yes stop_codon:yes gene_type:complete